MLVINMMLDSQIHLTQPITELKAFKEKKNFVEKKTTRKRAMKKNSKFWFTVPFIPKVTEKFN